MAITTENTYLIHKVSSGWEKLVDIKEFPDLGGAPSTIDITTLSDHMKTYKNGLVDPGNLEFNCNYDLDDYKKLVALEDDDEHEYGIQLGKNGENGVFAFKGDLSVRVKGGGVEASVDMGVSIAPCTEIELSETAKATIA